MFKLFGFLIGSAISIAVILLVTGMPEFHLKDPQIDQQRFDAAVEKLMARKQEAEQSVQQLTESATKAVETVQVNINSPDDEAIAQSEPTDPVVPQTPVRGDEDVAQRESKIGFVPPGNEVQHLTEAQWYSFWNPFRSEIAANGFVSQLEKVTGLDYRVVRIKTGVYEVAFAYDDDDERRTKLSQISAATGLDLPES